MTIKRLLALVMISWGVIAVASLLTRTTLLTRPFTFAEAAGWLFLACAPAATFFFIARGSTAPTMADMLRDGTHLNDRQVPATPEARDLARRS